MADGMMKMLMQLGMSKGMDYPDATLIFDLVNDPEKRKLLELIFARWRRRPGGAWISTMSAAPISLA